MIKVIETNISVNTGITIKLDEENPPIDFQSRVIEIDSWDSYVKEIKERKSITRKSVLGSLYGESFPRYASLITDFKYDDSHLMYTFVNGIGSRMIKLVYLITE